MPSRKLLVVGLAKPPSLDVAPHQFQKDGENLAQKIADSRKKLQQAGFDVTMLQSLPEDFDTFVQDIKKRLREEKWDGYIIGFGIRGVQAYTVTFEKLVNAGRLLAPDAIMGFNTTPSDIGECAERMFAESD